MDHHRKRALRKKCSFSMETHPTDADISPQAKVRRSDRKVSLRITESGAPAAVSGTAVGGRNGRERTVSPMDHHAETLKPQRFRRFFFCPKKGRPPLHCTLYCTLFRPCPRGHRRSALLAGTVKTIAVCESLCYTVFEVKAYFVLQHSADKKGVFP